MVRYIAGVCLFGWCLTPWAGVVAGGQDDYVSAASQVVGTYRPHVDARTPAAMGEAAQALLASLDDPQRSRMLESLDSPERREWTNLPARPNAGGLRLGDMTEDQVRRTLDLLATTLSEKGYAKVCQIMLGDDQLLRGGQPRAGFGTEDFSLVLFGQPAPGQNWALQLDGHHLGLNVSLNGDRYSLSPSFIGAQPEAFEIAGKRFQPLQMESKLAYQFVANLTDAQKRTAVLGDRRGDLRAGPGQDGAIPRGEGISGEALDPAQREALLTLVDQWIGIQPDWVAGPQLEKLRAEIPKTKFAWRGSTADRSDVSFVIQGPHLIIEFACQPLGGNPLDHLHTMYRDPANEYAGQIPNPAGQ